MINRCKNTSCRYFDICQFLCTKTFFRGKGLSSSSAQFYGNGNNSGRRCFAMLPVANTSATKIAPYDGVCHIIVNNLLRSAPGFLCPIIISFSVPTMPTLSKSKRHLQRIIASAIACTVVPLAFAGDFPEKSIRLSVGYPAGGLSDVVARRLAEKVADTLKVAVVVENRPGAGGTINIAEISRAKPDGYTLAFSATSPLTLTPFFSKVSYTPESAVTPVIGVMYSPVVLLGTQVLKAHDFKTFVDVAKQAPGKVRWATSGMGTIGHIMFGQISHDEGLDMTLVPYKGGSQQMNDALGGQFEVFSTNVSASLIENIKAGKLHALAIGADQRLEGLADVPTFTELNQPKANLKSNFGIFAPAGTPATVIETLNKAFDAALQEQEIADSLRQSGNIPSGGSAAKFQKTIDEESRNNQAIIRQAGLATK